MTPSLNEADEFGQVHSVLAPKGTTIQGTVLLQLYIEKFDFSFSGLIYDANQLAKPTFFSTLTFELITKYPNKSPLSYDNKKLQTLEQYIASAGQAKIDLFGLTTAENPHVVLKFLKNSLSVDLEFLRLAKEAGIEFNYDNQGLVNAAPYPFGLPNSPPRIDEARSTPFGNLSAKETVKFKVKMEASDPDFDKTFVLWTLEGEPVVRGAKEFSWIPDFEDSRSAPYKLIATVSDGGITSAAAWDIYVTDTNRMPTLEKNCPAEVKEGETWKCTITTSDPDGDPLFGKLIPGGYLNAIPKLSGNAVDVEVAGSSFEIIWKPDNKDFVNQFQNIVLQIDDHKQGVVQDATTVKLFSVNSPPQILPDLSGNPLRFYDPSNQGDARELDNMACLNRDEDSKVANKKFLYRLYVIDPDNTGSVTNDDLHSVKISGTLSSSFKPEPATPLNANRVKTSLVQNGVTYPATLFTFAWQPSALTKSGSVALTVSDDQGGIGNPVQVNLNAVDRAVLPCPQNRSGTINMTNTFQTPTVIHSVVYDEEKDSPDVPLLQVEPTLPAGDAFFTASMYIMDSFSNDAVVFKKNFYETTYKYYQDRADASLKLRSSLQSLYAGVVMITRSTCTASNAVINIPLGTAFKSIYTASPYVPRVTYATAIGATLDTLDCSVVIPLNATNRVAAAGTLSRISPAIAGLSVTNLTSFDDQTAAAITVRFSRASSATALTIPKLTTVRSDEAGGAESFVYVVPADIVMPTTGPTSLSVDVRVARDFNKGTTQTLTNALTTYDAKAVRSPIIANKLTWVNAPIAGVTIKNPVEIFPRKDIPGDWFNNQGGDATYRLVARGLDPQTPAADSSLLMAAQYLQSGSEAAATITSRNQTGFANVRVRNPLFSNPLYGTVEFYRTVNGGNINIVAGLIISTADRKLYKVLTAGVLGAANTIRLPVTRFYETSYAPFAQTINVLLRDMNRTARMVNTTFSWAINQVETEMPMQASDNVSSPFEPLAPTDPFDRFTYQVLPFDANDNTPTGPYSLCRNPLPAACVPCTDGTLANISHEDSRFCYLRFTPAVLDIAEGFAFNIRVTENLTGPTNLKNSFDQTILVNVRETNVAPTMTNAAGTALATGTASVTTNTLGTATEGLLSQFQIYATDPNKSTDFKTIGFELVPNVYHLKTGNTGLKPIPPGMKITNVVNTFNASGISTNASAVLEWTPTDEDAKRFSSTEGFVVGIKAYDSPGNPGTRLSKIHYFKVFLKNTNSTPEIGLIGDATKNNQFTVLADTYFSANFRISDPDAYTPVLGTFVTTVNPCLNFDGTQKRNPLFDAVAATPTSCHMTGATWSTGTYDPNYQKNKNVGVPTCRSGANEDLLNQDLAVPKISLVGGPYLDNLKIAYDYKFEWCPQQGQTGSYQINLSALDNGDRSVANLLAPPKSGSSSVNLTVISPVHLISPRLNLSGQPEHYLHQTAARVGDATMRYQTLVSNSKGNPLIYRILNAPRACGVDGGVCISSTGLITWNPLRDDISDTDPASLRRIEIEVEDSVTHEKDRAHFYLSVQDPSLAPYEQTPQIDSRSPNADFSLPEMSSYTLSVTASDPNVEDILHYTWYVDGVVQYDEGSSFLYRTSFSDGSIDTDGAGPLLAGQHKIQVVVNDGNYQVSTSWTVSVTNTVVAPTMIFDLASERKAMDPSESFQNFQWGYEFVDSSLLQIGSIDSLVFTGTYKRENLKKNFLWSLDFLNGTLSKTGHYQGVASWNFFDGLYWSSGLDTQKLSYKKDVATQSMEFYVTGQTSRYGPFSTTIDADRLFGDLTKYRSPLDDSDKCSPCDRPLNLNPSSAHGFQTQIGNVGYYLDANGKDLYWDINSNTSSKLLFKSFAAGESVGGLVVNPRTNRLFVSIFDGTAANNKIYVFDVAPTLAATPTSPTQVGIIDVAGAHPLDATIPSLPTTLALDPTYSASPARENRIFGFLKGTGGVVTFVDAIATVPTTAIRLFVGAGVISPSFSDTLNQSSRMLFDQRSDLIFGVSREGQQVFSINPITLDYSMNSMPAPMDSFLISKDTGLSLLIDKSRLQVYRAK